MARRLGTASGLLVSRGSCFHPTSPSPTSLPGGPKWGDSRTGKRWMPLEGAPLSPGIWAVPTGHHRLCYLH